MHSKMIMNAILLTLVGLLIASEVSAVVGRPATPVSVAGVARRSVRR